jgi:hypothetical protein
MKLLDDLDSIYTKAKDFFIGYVIGYGIAIVITLAVFYGMLFHGCSPIPKHISEQPRSGIPRGWDGTTITTDTKTP